MNGKHTDMRLYNPKVVKRGEREHTVSYTDGSGKLMGFTLKAVH